MVFIKLILWGQNLNLGAADLRPRWLYVFVAASPPYPIRFWDQHVDDTQIEVVNRRHRNVACWDAPFPIHAILSHRRWLQGVCADPRNYDVCVCGAVCRQRQLAVRCLTCSIAFQRRRQSLTLSWPTSFMARVPLPSYIISYHISISISCSIF